MKLFEIKDDVVTINIDTKIIKKFASKPRTTKIDYGDYGDIIVNKITSGNQDAIIKAIGIAKKALCEAGCQTYEELYRRISD